MRPQKHIHNNGWGSRFRMVKERHARTFDEAIARGKADEKTSPLCQFFRNTQHFFTSSSCSGRIALIRSDTGKTKQENSFFGKWHSPVDPEEAWEQLCKNAGREEVWLKQQPFILHIGTDNTENASTLLAIMRAAGMKRGGIMLLEPGKIMVEVTGTHNLSLPVKKKNKILVSREYFEFLITKANAKMNANQKRLELFERLCREQLD